MHHNESGMEMFRIHHEPEKFCYSVNVVLNCRSLALDNRKYELQTTSPRNSDINSQRFVVSIVSPTVMAGSNFQDINATSTEDSPHVSKPSKFHVHRSMLAMWLPVLNNVYSAVQRTTEKRMKSYFQQKKPLKLLVRPFRGVPVILYRHNSENRYPLSLKVLIPYP